MTRSRRAVALVVLPVVLALGACAGRAGTATPTPTPTSTEPAQPADIAPWATPTGIAPELVYVTDVEGFDLATQSVGVVGDDGFSAIYTRAGDGVLSTVALTTAPTAVVDLSVVAPCAELPDAPAALRCAVVRGEAYVLLEGQDVEAATLRAAGAAVRLPRVDELPYLFTDVMVPSAPVVRGDLPPFGDGAPVDPERAGG
ncbi:membrane protein [Cellulomonas chitinilytica]|uniref:Membrane protein n=1 Tax=Cellulomonas chitinilytica TaxID=398759 RepID=A0A919P7V1_9CELL|nr:hypothetical protein [Cellulomonas chitinilytica]GIG23732.1 membrane protein [Cellulomonas chitinilytica]